MRSLAQTSNICYVGEIQIINLRHACVARVIVVVLCVCVCVCVCVCPLITAALHIGITNRDTNEFIAIQGSFKILPISLKMLNSKVMA